MPREVTRHPLRRHRWWLALAAALLTPWIGPHVDSYVPLAAVLFRAREETPDVAFWVLAGGFIAVVYAVWLAILTGVAAWLARRESQG